jgi:hypothetical protein
MCGAVDGGAATGKMPNVEPEKKTVYRNATQENEINELHKQREINKKRSGEQEAAATERWMTRPFRGLRGNETALTYRSDLI